MSDDLKKTEPQKEKKQESSWKNIQEYFNGWGIFWFGLLVGVIFTAVVFVMFMGMYRLHVSQIVDEYDKLGHISEEGEQSLDEIYTKMEVLQGCIDSYFLYEEDYEAVAESVYKAMVSALGDRYSTYYTKEEYESVIESNEGTYYGIGATVTKDEETGYVRVVSMFEGGGAIESGMENGDLITEIAGTDISDMDVSSAAALMKGEEGTTVEVKVYRPSTGETLTLTITRRKVDLDTVAYQMLDNNIGYIAISEFDSVTVEQFENALNTLTEQGMEGLIVDLRDNPGGLMNSVNGILDMLLPEGLIVYTEDKYGNRKDYTSDAEWNDVPMSLIVNGHSASASEIFAGAMKDYERATLVGTQTYGKGIVQTSRQLPDGSAIKLTVARYYTPNGICIHEVGVAPDIEIEYDSEAVEGLEVITWKDDNQVVAAYNALLEKIGE